MLESAGEVEVSVEVQVQAVVVRVDKSEAGRDFGHPPTHRLDALLLAERHVEADTQLVFVRAGAAGVAMTRQCIAREADTEAASTGKSVKGAPWPAVPSTSMASC